MNKNIKFPTDKTVSDTNADEIPAPVTHGNVPKANSRTIEWPTSDQIKQVVDKTAQRFSRRIQKLQTDTDLKQTAELIRGLRRQQGGARRGKPMKKTAATKATAAPKKAAAVRPSSPAKRRTTKRA